MLSERQKIQEQEYALPYHWFKDRSTFGGRVYFGYQNICLEVVRDMDLGAKILDAGCGDGRFLGVLRERGFINLYGTDYSERAVSFARLLLPEAAMSVADLTALSYEDNFFDAIFMIETLEHIIPESIPVIISNFKRVLKPGGKLIITVPSKNAPMIPNSKHYQHFSADSLTAYLKNDFNVIEIIGQDKSGFSLLNILYSLLDNRFWDIKFLRQRYNLKWWSRWYNRCGQDEGRRLIAVCQKS